MKKRVLIILFILILFLIYFIPVAGAEPPIIGGVTEPETTVTTHPTTEPTPEPTTIPTTVRTAEPTTEPTTVSTTEPTILPTVTEPTTVRTTEPTTVPTTEPTITIEPTTQFGGGTGYFDIYVNVNGATVVVGGKTAGTTPPNPVIAEVYSTGAPATITVSAPGYVTWSQTPGNPPENQHVTINANLVPIVTTRPTTSPTSPPVTNGAIYAQSYPAGAAIYMNGVLQGNAPMTIPNLVPNSYAMRASLNGYTSDNTVINVYAGQTAYYSPTLQPSPSRNTGTVYVTSNPSYASVYVDGSGNYYGKTPVTLTLYPGSHTVLVRLSGYNDYTTTVWVNGGQAQNLPVSLTPAIFGSVLVTSMPGASVYMDSILQGRIGSDGTLTLPSIPSGNHIFKVSATGYNDWINTVYIQPNYQNRITATLTPIGPNPTPVPPTGGLNIVSSPSGAETYVDNQYYGYTPATLTGISVGQHSVTLKYTGYVDYLTTVTVNAGQTTPLAITMSPTPTPTPKSAPSPAVMIGGLCAIIGTVMALRRR